MCGFAGLYHCETAKPVDPARIRAMIDVQAHRGPDGSDVWTAPGVGLGHVRLAIIDLAGSPQPMHTEDGALSIVYNGEVYNYPEIRAELQGRGHVFRTSGDTEVILLGYREWGAGVLDRLNGMFAFAIHDARENSLFMARDRLGVKPLHFASLSDGSIAFSSELKGLLAHPLLRREPDLTAVDDYLAFGYVPDHASLVAGVKKLPAGHWLKLERGRPLAAPTCWWDVDFSSRSTGNEAALEEEMRHLLADAVKLRMVSDVPVGAFLSGGVDSSTVVAMMAAISRTPVQTCSIGFDVGALDETAYAQRVAERFRTEHRARTVSPDDFGAIDVLANAFDEPFADASALPTWRVCQLARETVTVALSGDGADEAFAGYRRHKFQHAEERARSLLPSGFRRSLLGGLGAIYPKADWAPRFLRAKSTLLNLAQDGDEAYARSVGVMPPELRHPLYAGALAKVANGYRAEDKWVEMMRAAPARDPLDRAQYADLKFWLPGDILTKVDRTSMAVSLEAREPLLDYRLIEFGARLPVNLRIRGGEGKWLLKKTMQGTLPDDILYRPKMGFVTPISAWFRGALASEAERVVSRSRLADSGWFDTGKLQALVAAHRNGSSDHGRLIWQLVMLDKALQKLF